MAHFAAMLAAGALSIVSSTTASGGTAHRLIQEKEVRAISAKHYSELLRTACANGWRYRQADVAHGFQRSFEELSLTFIDQGYVIAPDAAAPQLVVTEIAADWRKDRNAGRRFGCFRARWGDD